MRIKTRLRINSIVLLTLMVLLILFLIRSFGEVSTAQQNAALVSGMQKAAFERTVVRDEYLLHREIRARRQWLAKTEMLGRLLETAADRLSNPRDRELLADIKRDFEETVAIFGKLMESEDQAETGRLISEEGRKRLIGKILLRAYSLNDLIDRLQQSAEKALRAAYDRALLWLFLFIAFVVLGAIGSSAALDRLLSRRLARLREGTAIIGSGRLDYRFPIEGSDELWDLAIASNEMAAKLQDSHTSINHLQQEISERERAQEALRVLFARQEALLAAVPDIIMEVDCNKMYTWANQAGIEFFGEDVIGREAADYFFGEQDTYGMMQPLFNGDENTLYVESLQRRKDGQERLLAWWCRVLKDDRGNVTGSLSSARDITEIKLAERQKADMEAQLRHAQKLESIGTLASGVAHEINNPINGVMNYAQLILDQSAPGAVAAEYAREIISETERVAVIVRNLLQFARQEKQTHSPARMEDIIDAVLSLMGAVLRHDQIRLEVDIGAGLPTVKCRSQQIQQVVMNMLSNARDALNEKYPDHHEDKAVSIRCRAFEKAGRPWMRVTVEDHGGGISLAIRDRIFDPFFTTKSKDKGTGLGLAISHGLVKEHHGDLHFETEPGHWTRFHLDLPVNNGWALQQAGEGKGNG